MPDHRGFYALSGSVTLTLPNGQDVECQPLKLSDAARFMRLLDDAKQRENYGAILEIIEAFPKAVGAPEAFEDLDVAEFLQVVVDFFARRRMRQTTTPPPATSTSD